MSHVEVSRSTSGRSAPGAKARALCRGRTHHHRPATRRGSRKASHGVFSPDAVEVLRGAELNRIVVLDTVARAAAQETSLAPRLHILPSAPDGFLFQRDEMVRRPSERDFFYVVRR